MAEHNDADNGTLRTFGTGATRDTAEGKLDMEGFTHPMVMKQFAKYMSMNRLQSDGKTRDSDNWQKGIDMDAYMKSLKRHCDDLWLEHRGFPTESGVIAALCGIMFNSMGYLHEVLKMEDWHLQDFDGGEPTPEIQRRIRKLADLEPKTATSIKAEVKSFIDRQKMEQTSYGEAMDAGMALLDKHLKEDTDTAPSVGMPLRSLVEKDPVCHTCKHNGCHHCDDRDECTKISCDDCRHSDDNGAPCNTVQPEDLNNPDIEN